MLTMYDGIRLENTEFNYLHRRFITDLSINWKVDALLMNYSYAVQHFSENEADKCITYFAKYMSRAYRIASMLPDEADNLRTCFLNLYPQNLVIRDEIKHIFNSKNIALIKSQVGILKTDLENSYKNSEWRPLTVIRLGYTCLSENTPDIVENLKRRAFIKKKK